MKATSNKSIASTIITIPGFNSIISINTQIAHTFHKSSLYNIISAVNIVDKLGYGWIMKFLSKLQMSSLVTTCLLISATIYVNEKNMICLIARYTIAMLHVLLQCKIQGITPSKDAIDQKQLTLDKPHDLQNTLTLDDNWFDWSFIKKSKLTWYQTWNQKYTAMCTQFPLLMNKHSKNTWLILKFWVHGTSKWASSYFIFAKKDEKIKQISHLSSLNKCVKSKKYLLLRKMHCSATRLAVTAVLPFFTTFPVNYLCELGNIKKSQ